MDPRLFLDGTMGIRGDLVDLPMPARLVYDPAQDTLFLNGYVCVSCWSIGNQLFLQRHR
jgi:hypothetical protein